MTPAAPPLPPLTAPWPRWAVLASVWTAFGLVAAAQHHLSFSLSRGVSLPWSTSFLLMMPIAYVWALATPGIQSLSRQFPINRTQWPRSLPVHAATCLGLVSVLVVAYAVYSARVLPPAVPVPVLERSIQVFVAWALTDVVLYVAVVGVTFAVDQLHQVRERDVRASQLETQLAQAELQALKMQLQPHFVFNALHTIGSLVRTGDRDNAVRVVTGLGDLLRRVVDGATEQEVPFEQEMSLVHSYLAIEQVRFSDRLAVVLELDPAVLPVLVPHLVLQPLVENAIRHGIEPHPGAGRLRITARRDGHRVRIEVYNDGPPGSGPAAAGRLGVGLGNTRARLERLYGAAAELRTGPVEGGGHMATVILPFRTAATRGEASA